jgi:predicted polyphosphate/ATP-dependent NAD kinase
MNEGGNFKVALPSGVRNYADLKRARFEEVGAGRLTAVMDGEIRVTNDKLADLTSELKKQASIAAQSVSQPELMTR